MDLFFVSCNKCGSNNFQSIPSDGLLQCSNCGKKLSTNSLDYYSKTLYNAETYLRLLHDKKEAENLFREASRIDPGRCYGWWGIVRAISDDFTNAAVGRKALGIIIENQEKAFAVATTQEKEIMKKEWSKYEDLVDNYMQKLETNVEQLRQQLDNAKKEKEIKEKRLISIKKEISYASNKKINIGIYLFLIDCVLAIISFLGMLYLCSANDFSFGWGLLIHFLFVVCLFYVSHFIKKKSTNQDDLQANLDQCKNDINVLSKRIELLKKECNEILEKMK